MNRYEGILLDVGGTLLNGEPSDEMILKTNMAKLGIHVTYDQVLNAFHKTDLWVLEHSINSAGIKSRFTLPKVGLGIAQVIFEQLCETCSIKDPTKVYERYKQLEPTIREWYLVDQQIYMTLEKLLENGYRLGVVSNWGHGLRDVLASAGLEKFFEVVIASSESGSEKPNPKMLLRACKTMALSPDRCLYVGDFFADVLCARFAQMDVALIGEGAKPLLDSIGIKADYSLCRPSDLLGVLLVV